MQTARSEPKAPLFETINVSKTFGAFKALSDVCFHVNDGEFVSSSDQTARVKRRWSIL